ncbi:MAG: response regulator [Bdellovibrio sp.]|nr:response regulator [Bdellovibrio sp.]
MRSLDLLVIEDDDSHAEIIKRYLRRSDGIKVNLTRKERLQEGLSKMALQKFDALLLDLRLPDSEIQDTLPRAVKVSQQVPIVVLSSLEDRDSAIRAVQEGAQDYLCKANLSSELLMRTILNSIERKENELRIRQQLEQNSFLFELSQYALGEFDTDKVKGRCHETLLRALAAEYVEIVDLPDGAYKHEPPHPDQPHEPTILKKLSEVGLAQLENGLVQSGLTSGVNIVLENQQNGIVFGVIIVRNPAVRPLKEEEIKFIQAVANILTSLFIRKNLRDQLHQKISDLQDAHQKKDDFLATLSHELRSPLNIISGYLEVLKAPNPPPGDLQRAITGIENGLRIEIKLIEEILDLSRIITGKMQLSVSEFNLSDSIQQVLDSIKPAVSAKKLDLQVDIASEVHNFFGDQKRIQQVLWNLLSNAVKFTPKRGTIRVKATIQSSHFQFDVYDNGKGILLENQKYVFNRFWQEDSSISRQQMGLGLGLGIVKQIVELHGGTVAAESAGANQGAHFSISLPLAPVSEMTEAAPSPSGNTPIKNNPGVALTNKNILVIDDAEDAVALMKLLLQKRGARVTGCSDPEQALEIAKKENFDIIISDIGMPLLNGYELMKSYRQWERESNREPTPAIALTAYATTEDAKKSQEAGFQTHLPKPMNIGELTQEIQVLTEDV